MATGVISNTHAGSTLSVQFTPNNEGAGSISENAHSMAAGMGAFVTSVSPKETGALASTHWGGIIELKRSVDGKDQVVRKFEIEATYPEGLDETTVKNYWEAQLNYLYNHYPEQLPANGATNEVTVHKDKLEIKNKDALNELANEIITESCNPYVTGSKNELNEIVEALKTSNNYFESFTGTKPVEIEHKEGSSTCWGAATIWSLLNDPVLLPKLPFAAKKNKELKSLNEFMSACLVHQKANTMVTSDDLEKFRNLLNALIGQNSQKFSETNQDATEAINIISNKISEQFDETLKLETTLKLEDNSQYAVPSSESLVLHFPSTQGGNTPITLENLLDHTFASENTDPRETFKAIADRKITSHHTQLTNATDRIPITLSRWKKNETGPYVKDDRKVIVPLTATFKKSYFKDNVVSDDKKYYLGLIILQSGDISNGHYTCIVRKPDGQGKLINYHCDDFKKPGEKIKIITDEKCAELAQDAYKLDYFSEEASKPLTKSAKPAQQNLTQQPQSIGKPADANQVNSPQGKEISVEGEETQTGGPREENNTKASPPQQTSVSSKSTTTDPLQTKQPVAPLIPVDFSANIAEAKQVYQGPLGQSTLTIAQAPKKETPAKEASAKKTTLIDIENYATQLIGSKKGSEKINKLLPQGTGSLSESTSNLVSLSESTKAAVLKAARHLKFKEEIIGQLNNSLPTVFDLRPGQTGTESNGSFIRQMIDFRKFDIDTIEKAYELFREAIESSNVQASVGVIFEEGSIKNILNLTRSLEDSTLTIRCENKNKTFAIATAPIIKGTAQAQVTDNETVRLQFRTAMATLKKLPEGATFYFDVRPSSASAFSPVESLQNNSYRFKINPGTFTSEEIRKTFSAELQYLKCAKDQKITLILADDGKMTINNMQEFINVDLQNPKMTRGATSQPTISETTPLLLKTSVGTYEISRESAPNKQGGTSRLVKENAAQLKKHMADKIIDALEQDEKLVIDFRDYAEAETAMNQFKEAFSQITQVNPAHTKLTVKMIIPEGQPKLGLTPIKSPGTFENADKTFTLIANNASQQQALTQGLTDDDRAKAKTAFKANVALLLKSIPSSPYTFELIAGDGHTSYSINSSTITLDIHAKDFKGISINEAREIFTQKMNENSFDPNQKISLVVPLEALDGAYVEEIKEIELKPKPQEATETPASSDTNTSNTTENRGWFSWLWNAVPIIPLPD